MMIWLYYIIWSLILAVFQPTLARGIEICGIAPNLFLCFVVIIGFYRGRTEGAIVGMVFGLIYDLLIGRMIGVNSLIYLFLGFGAGILSNQFFGGGKRLASVVTVFAGTVLSGVIYYFIRKMGWGDIGFVTAVFRISLAEAVYNGAVSFLLAFPMVWIMKVMRIERMV